MTQKTKTAAPNAKHNRRNNGQNRNANNRLVLHDGATFTETEPASPGHARFFCSNGMIPIKSMILRKPR